MRAVILAGGQASRFGGKPKGLELVGGARILDRVVSAVAAAAGELPLLVANSDDATSWRPDLRVVRDLVPGQGSLGGIHTAINDGAGPVLVVAWDMPFVAAPLLADLMTRSAGFDAYLPAAEPLCAVYGKACAEAIGRQLARGERKATAFHSEVRVGQMTRSAVEQFGDPDVLFFNVNSAADLAKAEELWQNRRG